MVMEGKTLSGFAPVWIAPLMVFLSFLIKKLEDQVAQNTKDIQTLDNKLTSNTQTLDNKLTSPDTRLLSPKTPMSKRTKGDSSEVLMIEDDQP